MSYLLRLTLLSLGVFFLNYLLVSSALAAFWPLIRRRASRWKDSALYSVRVSPLAIAAAIVALLLIPSFLYLEPSGIGEALSAAALAFAFGGIAVLLAGGISVLLACRRTAQFVAAHAKVGVEKTSAIEVYGTAPMLAVAGAYHPRLLVSRDLKHVLAPGEMHAAIQHELAHIHRHDNLKKLVFRFARFPFLAGLERAWLNAAELAADDAAATSEVVAVDLASALLKVAGTSNSAPLPDLAMSLVPERDHALRLRVERLLAWKPRSRTRRRFSSYAAPIVFAVVLLAITYSPLLRHVHELTELFAR